MADPMDWEDLEAEARESLLDDRLRLELQRSLSVDEQAEDVLVALGPAMSQAKRKRILGQIATGVVASVLMFAGIGVAVQALPDSDRNQTFAGEPDASIAGDTSSAKSAEDQEAEEPVKATIEVAGSTVPPGLTTSQPSESEDQNVSPSTSEQASAPGTTENQTPTTTGPGTETTPPNATTAPTTSPGETPTTNLTDGTVINSDCGSILVSRDEDDNITLLDVDPRTGFTVETKSAGPESVEVAFKSRDEECEVKAKVENGELEIEGGEE